MSPAPDDLVGWSVWDDVPGFVEPYSDWDTKATTRFYEEFGEELAELAPTPPILWVHRGGQMQRFDGLRWWSYE